MRRGVCSLRHCQSGPISVKRLAHINECLSASYPNSCSAIEYKLKGLLPESARELRW